MSDYDEATIEESFSEWWDTCQPEATDPRFVEIARRCFRAGWLDALSEHMCPGNIPDSCSEKDDRGRPCRLIIWHQGQHVFERARGWKGGGS